MPNPRGRQPVGPNQPPGGGSNYPFVRPSSDIKYLLADLFVSFDDIDDQVKYPLHVTWLYGFGSDAAGPLPGYPTPAHARDILIADDNGLTIFDSTQATAFTESMWDDRLRISEWVGDTGVCRTVMHTQWTQADLNDNLTQTYDNHIAVINGELNADAWYAMPKRVLSLQVGLTNITNKRVVLSGGYNVEFEHLTGDSLIDFGLGSINQTQSVIPGERKANRITLTAEPGSGLGVFPGCIDSEQMLRTINRIKGSEHQDFTYDSEGCIRTKRPVGLSSLEPREFKYGSFELTPTASASAIQTSNDCVNCCDCEYFAQTYQGIKRQWFLHQEIAGIAESTRDLYAENRDRWLVQKSIREKDALRVRVSADGDCKISWGFAHCNPSRCCINGIGIRLTWLYYINGVLVPPTTSMFDCNKTEIDGSAQCDGPEEILLDSSDQGRSSYFFLDFADPQTITTVQGRHCFPGCDDLGEDSLRVQLAVHLYWQGEGIDPKTGEPCEYPTINDADIPIDVRTTWDEIGIPIPPGIRTQKLSQPILVSSDNPFCSRCSCN